MPNQDRLMQDRWPFSRVGCAPSVPLYRPKHWNAYGPPGVCALALTKAPSISRARAAMREAADDVLVGDPEGHALRQALANKHGVDSSEVAGVTMNFGSFRGSLSIPEIPSLPRWVHPHFQLSRRQLKENLHCVPYKDDCDIYRVEEMARREEPKLFTLPTPITNGTWHKKALPRSPRICPTRAAAGSLPILPSRGLAGLSINRARIAPAHLFKGPEAGAHWLRHSAAGTRRGARQDTKPLWH